MGQSCATVKKGREGKGEKEISVPQEAWLGGYIELGAVHMLCVLGLFSDCAFFSKSVTLQGGGYYHRGPVQSSGQVAWLAG